MVSDLYDKAGFERGLDLLRHRKYEPHVIQIYDPYEKEPADMLGDIEMWDVESGVFPQGDGEREEPAAVSAAL